MTTPKVKQDQGHGGCCCTGKSTVSTNEHEAGIDRPESLPLQQLRVKGAHCGGCVKNIEQTLRSVAGVSEVSMDLATGIASVVGIVEPNDLIEALDRVGFPAAAIN
ncbi:heavy metal-associated domain-containing protein [Microbulbifer magnicolonia]|uniref:heavy-metal-associated domain-containing protein n=1 Tax=Microbulbifer magnicolonia TaxID=3109744 RepID=UPI002B40E9EF|nr:heavy metal-associated domain-containing protein [Microbulbifer sp. GG15]